MAAPIAELFATVKSSGSQRCAGTIFDSWMQGRTTFGGLSAALCLEGARRLLTQEVATTQPLRSAMVAFVGPAGGAADVASSFVNQGKRMSFVRSELSCEGSVATSAVFAFGSPRESNFDEVLVPLLTDVNGDWTATAPRRTSCSSRRCKCIGGL